ncbi:MAG: hypothetical protein WAO32_08050 [Defluviitoga tunisiensis]
MSNSLILPSFVNEANNLDAYEDPSSNIPSNKANKGILLRPSLLASVFAI